MSVVRRSVFPGLIFLAVAGMVFADGGAQGGGSGGVVKTILKL
jgi:hypothetical protein